MFDASITNPIITTVILAILGWLGGLSIKGIKKHDVSHQLLKEANLYQIKARLRSIYRVAKEHGKKIDEQDYEIFNDLYTVYKKLGGNSFMDGIKLKIDKFEITIDE